jgi:2-oxoglutarate dehydrogenase E1 component
VPREQLVELVDALNTMPPGFVAHPNLLRQLHRREQMVRGERPHWWGCAEALARGRSSPDGVSIRLAGQDSGRGTFSHRHSVVHHQATDEEHVPLAALARAIGKGSTFEVRDSLLSEEAALGFEYGYSLGRVRTLTLWEAQFGDFVNGAQVPIDQFILSGQAKWRLDSSLVLLLPHGYDGQGPEHSSARPERFLAACSAGNAIIANCSTAAQYYHLLRRQGASERRRPLVLFTPKSLLREIRAASPIDDLARGSFEEVHTDERPIADATRRVLLRAGKISHELAARREERRIEDIALLRVEQLYPFPRQALLAELDRAPRADVVWIQEEPRNMGAWSLVLQRFQDLARPIRYLGRPESASPATGSYRRHQLEQEWIAENAFAPAS